jgi:hypothetical protein
MQRGVESSAYANNIVNIANNNGNSGFCLGVDFVEQGPTDEYPNNCPNSCFVNVQTNGSGHISAAQPVWSDVGFAVGQILYVYGPNGSQNGTLAVGSVDGSNRVSTLTVNTAGTGYPNPLDGIWGSNSVFPAESAQIGFVDLGTSYTTIDSTGTYLPVQATGSNPGVNTIVQYFQKMGGLGYAVGQWVKIHGHVSGDTDAVLQIATTNTSGGILTFSNTHTTPYAVGTYATGEQGLRLEPYNAAGTAVVGDYATAAAAYTGETVGAKNWLQNATASDMIIPSVWIETLSSPGSATAGDVYHNAGGDSVTVLGTISSGSVLYLAGNEPWHADGSTLTRYSGTGDTTLNCTAHLTCPLPLGLLVNGFRLQPEWNGLDSTQTVVTNGGLSNWSYIRPPAGWVGPAEANFSWIIGYFSTPVSNTSKSSPYSPYFASYQPITDILPVATEINDDLSPEGAKYIRTALNGNPPTAPSIFHLSGVGYLSTIADWKTCVDTLALWQTAGLIRCVSPTTYFTPSQWNAPNSIHQSIDMLASTAAITSAAHYVPPMRSTNATYCTLSATGGNPGQCIVLQGDVTASTLGSRLSGRNVTEPTEDGFLIGPVLGVVPGRIHELDFDVCGSNLAVQMIYTVSEMGNPIYQTISDIVNQDVTLGYSTAGYYSTYPLSSLSPVLSTLDTWSLFGSGDTPTSNPHVWRHYKIPIGVPTWAESTSIKFFRVQYGSNSSDTATTKLANVQWRLD